MKTQVAFNLTKIKSNIEHLVNNTKNIQFIYPLKCCDNKNILALIKKYNFGLDISNYEEYETIKKFISPSMQISISGPKAHLFPYEKTSNNMTIIYDTINNENIKNFDNFNNCGVRINFNYDKRFEKSRFGMPLEEAIVYNDKIKHIHFHIHDNNKIMLLPALLEKIKYILANFHCLKTINIGGHYEYYKNDEALQIFNSIRHIIPLNIDLIVEAAGLLFEYSGTMSCTIINVKQIEQIQYVCLDCSFQANLNWSKPRLDKIFRGEIPSIFVGATCSEQDIICESYSNRFYKVGEVVSFYNISPYSYMWNTVFNGIKKIQFIFKYF